MPRLRFRRTGDLGAGEYLRMGLLDLSPLEIRRRAGKSKVEQYFSNVMSRAYCFRRFKETVTLFISSTGSIRTDAICRTNML